MSEMNERSVASTGSVSGGSDIVDRLSDLSGDVGRWGGKTIGETIDEITRLRLAIRRLAEQDATLSVQGGNVIVEIDGTLTAEEREAVEWAMEEANKERHATLRGLLERMG